MRNAIIQFIVSVIIYRVLARTHARAPHYDVSAGDGPWLEIYSPLQEVTYLINKLSLAVAIMRHHSVDPSRDTEKLFRNTCAPFVKCRSSVIVLCGVWTRLSVSGIYDLVKAQDWLPWKKRANFMSLSKRSLFWAIWQNCYWGSRVAYRQQGRNMLLLVQQARLYLTKSVLLKSTDESQKISKSKNYYRRAVHILNLTGWT